MFPEDPLGFAIDDQYYVGDSGLLIKPITAQGVQDTVAYLSDNQVRAARILLTWTNCLPT
jgi:alpha 1,3-glucosidase